MMMTTLHTYLVAFGLAVIYCLLHILVLWIAYKILRSIFLNAFIAQPVLPIAFSQISILWIFGTWCVYLYDVFSLKPMLPQEVLNHVPRPFLSMDVSALGGWMDVLFGCIALAYVAFLVFNLRTFKTELLHTKRLHTLAQNQAPFHISIPSWFQSSLNQALAFWQHKKRPVVLFFSGKVGPLTISWMKPIIIYPTAALNHLTPEETSAIIAHEVGHIFSADFYTNVFLKFIVAVLPFNPWLKAWIKDIQFFQEVHCDKRVLQFYPRKTYVNALVKVAEYGQVALAQNAQSELLERMKYMYGEYPSPTLNMRRPRLRLHAKPYSIVLAVLVIFGGIFLSTAKKETPALAVHLPASSALHSRAALTSPPVALPSSPKRIVASATPVSRPSRPSHPSPSASPSSKQEVKPQTAEAKVEKIAQLEELSNWQTNSPEPIVENVTLTPVSRNMAEEEEIKNLQHFIVQSTLWMLDNKFFFPDGLEIKSLTPEELSLLMSEQTSNSDLVAQKIKRDVESNQNLASLRTLANQLKEKVIYLLYLETLDQGGDK